MLFWQGLLSVFLAAFPFSKAMLIAIESKRDRKSCMCSGTVVPCIVDGLDSNPPLDKAEQNLVFSHLLLMKVF